MNTLNRRTFIIAAAAGCASFAASHASAQAGKVAETDAQAAALGYKEDTTKVDQKKFPNHTPAQMCNGCQLYQGKPTDAVAPCTIFAGKTVAGKGWCSAWVKKAA